MTSPHQDYARRAAFSMSNTGADNLLLLLHGLGGDQNQPLQLVEGFQRPDLTVLAPDLRAHGDTPVVGSSQDFRFDALADDVIALLDRHQLLGKRTYIAGISMGAAIALRLALRPLPGLVGAAFIRPAFSSEAHPPNVRALELLGSLLQSGSADARTRLLESREYRAVAEVSESGATSLREQLTKPGAVERSVRLRAVTVNTAWARSHELRGLQVPSITVGVEKDPVHPLGLAEAWAQSLPHTALKVVRPPKDDDPAAHANAMQRVVLAHVEACLDGSNEPGLDESSAGEAS